MSVRILYLKKAYIEDEYVRQALHDDMAAFKNTTEAIFPDVISEVCAITEEGEWLMHGKRVDPAIFLIDYEYVVVFIHIGDRIYDIASAALSAYSKNNFFIYSVSDTLFHNAERLHNLIKTLDVKFPHQKHINMKDYNERVISTEDIVRAHVRDLFLPIHIVDTDHRKQIPTMHTKHLAYTPNEFAEILHAKRHQSNALTLREHIVAPTVYVLAIPGLRHKKIYTTIPLIYKEIEGAGFWDTTQLSTKEREAVIGVVEQVSSLAFNKQLVVYALSVHPKRGVFIQSTAPLFDYMIHHPGFFFGAATESGILPTELFVLLRDYA
ncbi:MAG: hypothetical protein RJB39_112 [Candidatus Parcubacteria bacterium]|jgi:hypothetical protein